MSPDVAGVLIVIILLSSMIWGFVVAPDRRKRALNELNRYSTELRYLGGYPFFEGPKLVRLYNRGDYFELEHLKIPKDKVMNLQIAVSTAAKAGDTAAGALAGQVLMGPVGALGGAALAAGASNSSVIQLSFAEGEATHDLYFDGADVMNAFPKLKLWLSQTSAQPTH